MYRLTVDSSIIQDCRFQRFLIQIGNRHLALGFVVDLWIIAQKYWIPNRLLIPSEAWKCAELPQALIECGLVEERPSGFYAKGSEGYFDWWFTKHSNYVAAGKKRAELGQRDASGRWIAGPTNQEAPSKPIEIQSSVSISVSKRKGTVDSAESTKLWKYYEERARKKGINPIHEGSKTNKLCKKIVDTLGPEQAKAIVDVYLNDNSPFVRDKSWPIGILVSQQHAYINKLNVSSERDPLDFGREY